MSGLSERTRIPKLEAKRILKDENPDLDGHTFKLECLTAANGISHEKAHDALSDVYGTVALAGLNAGKLNRNSGSGHLSIAANRL